MPKSDAIAPAIEKARGLRVCWDHTKADYPIQHWVIGKGWRLQRHTLSLWLEQPSQEITPDRPYLLGMPSNHPHIRGLYPKTGVRITYNPHKDSGFVEAETTLRYPIIWESIRLLGLTYGRRTWADGSQTFPIITAYGSHDLAPFSRYFPDAIEYSRD